MISVSLWTEELPYRSKPLDSPRVMIDESVDSLVVGRFIGRPAHQSYDVWGRALDRRPRLPNLTGRYSKFNTSGRTLGGPYLPPELRPQK